MLQDPKWDKPKLDYSCVGEILLKAADFIDKHGWFQGGLSYENRVCIIGAINAVEWNQNKKILAFDQFRRFVGVGNAASIAMWNDRVCQSKEQAIATLVGAAM